MNDMAPGSFGIPFQITDPERIPAKRYYDPEFFRMENERLWPRVWQMAARLEEIPNVGDYQTYEILGKSIIIVHTKDGVKAFHNTCRHRGLALVEGAGNCGRQGFVCPFHGWRWNTEGENTFVFAPHIFSPEVLDKAEINLIACRMELWGGMAWINLDDDAPALLDCLGPVAERMDVRNVDKLRADWWYGTVLPTNWKLAMEAFMESYHVMKTHPQLHMLAPSPQYASGIAADPGAAAPTPREAVYGFYAFLERLSDGMAGLVHADEVKVAAKTKDMPLPDDVPGAIGAFFQQFKTDLHADGQARGLAVPDINAVDASHPHKQVEFIFPHFFLLPFFGSMSSYRIRPLTSETCLFEIWSLAFLPDDHVSPKEPTMLPFDSEDFPEVPRQDYNNLPRQQRGLHGFEEMRLSKDWEGLISNYQRLIDGYLNRADPKELASATQLVNDGYDHTIIPLLV
ncbi:aromatic ring-hydroxylating dioxygenase subunit alpha [uncultured Sphingomonas sp.]|uniref:aromatic ring-hydroxylating oxygenase subunit alpha n=1 Tax=uncultured Sphingomonas sp. TaxID=158754 RepID=UPI002612A381|nr:aromatic ring-hydroxylating dioxygenase subunit alpha [uncultured Sphingomonas sp.]